MIQESNDIQYLKMLLQSNCVKYLKLFDGEPPIRSYPCVHPYQCVTFKSYYPNFCFRFYCFHGFLEPKIHAIFDISFESSVFKNNRHRYTFETPYSFDKKDPDFMKNFVNEAAEDIFNILENHLSPAVCDLINDDDPYDIVELLKSVVN